MNANLDEVLGQLGIAGGQFEAAVARLTEARRRYGRLWAYYSNPMRPATDITEASERPYRQAQEWGVPARITGYRAGSDPLIDGAWADQERKEVVIENDIAWRIDTNVDYLFGRMPVLQCRRAEGEQRGLIEQLVASIIQHNGGIRLLQQMALMGAVYGFVDIAVTLDTEAAAAMRTMDIKRASGLAAAANTGNTPPDAQAPAQDGEETAPDRQELILKLARLVSLQVVEPARAIVFTHPEDSARVLAYAQVTDLKPAGRSGIASAIIGALTGTPKGASQLVEVWGAGGWWRWRDGALEAGGGNSLGQIPVVHIQNSAVPFAYSGMSDVETLIPLQDELNTRLSDRAHRIAMESFRMYLAKSLDIKAEPPTPGRMWNGTADSEIQEIGGDASSPTEQQHIAEVREAMDKTSGVPPVAAGAIRNRIGNLTSAAALRVTLMSLLARTERRRAMYGEGLRQVCAMALQWLDVAGLFHTEMSQRDIEIAWANPLPENNAERLAEAKLKLEMGISREEVLRELGR